MNCPAVIDRSASLPSEDCRSSQLASSASAARVAADAGLLISWANPAARVPRATSASRWRAIVSMLRAV